MEEPEARRRLEAAAAEHAAGKASYEQARATLADVIRDVAPTLRQVEIVKATGYTRERIRQIVEGKA